MVQFDILIKNGLVVDPASDRQEVIDIGLENGRVAAVAQDLSSDSARALCDASGKFVFPGLVDTHVHLTPAADRGIGLQMLARGGVTCALDCSGPV